uniref:Putative secreted protein n=1 Tax=Ixodes ricinus TaxID=34613 RepID=A0A6B0UEH9_IXORI
MVSFPPVMFLSATMTVTFSRASTIATLRPMPLAPPVTSASRPSSSSEEVPGLYSGFWSVSLPPFPLSGGDSGEGESGESSSLDARPVIMQQRTSQKTNW